LHLKGKSADYLGIKGMIRCGAHVKALLDGGTVAVDDVDLTVRNANAVTLLFAAATNFAGYFDWKDGRLANVVIQSVLGQPCTVRYGSTVVRFETRKGEKYVLDGDLKRR
jgi:hypothetical protein